ncbi:hypothetical protein GIB67_028160 [Kingdonia uniflora]|uniref:Pentatricopeptide repeat-containing protein n=1 Tax=Kingdonia uniflora TaxID=39325 RepID=A0A7J7KZP0_9MAGN|nr:hypothetical protein GIB67_028160 [Kingdonia uniflora]
MRSSIVDIFFDAFFVKIVLYNAMIAGYAHHGYENKAIVLFEEMLDVGIKPDEITFDALLSACRHARLVEKGEKYFTSMTDTYGLSPEIHHYSCMVDLYGRTNLLKKAAEFIELDSTIWGSFLNACKLNGNKKLMREAKENLLRVETCNGARYVQLANVYATAGNWSDMSRIRRKIRGGEVQKLAGCSWVSQENKINIFTSELAEHLEVFYGIFCTPRLYLRSLNPNVEECPKLKKTGLSACQNLIENPPKTDQQTRVSRYSGEARFDVVLGGAHLLRIPLEMFVGYVGAHGKHVLEFDMGVVHPVALSSFSPTNKIQHLLFFFPYLFSCGPTINKFETSLSHPITPFSFILYLSSLKNLD